MKPVAGMKIKQVSDCGEYTRTGVTYLITSVQGQDIWVRGPRGETMISLHNFNHAFEVVN